MEICQKNNNKELYRNKDVEEWRRFTWITNNHLESFGLNFLRYVNRAAAA